MRPDARLDLLAGRAHLPEVADGKAIKAQAKGDFQKTDKTSANQTS
jgi:hypothetical protein